MRSRMLLLVLLYAVGCGDEDQAPAPAADAGSDAGAAWDASDPPVPVIAPPTPPTPPLMGPCPTGWREIEEGAVVSCEPWPATGRASCTGATVHLPGRPGCEPIGTACPVDGFPAGLPADAPIVYVLAGATAGDGTRDAPFGTIAEAGTPTAGTIIAVGRGTYTERVQIGAGVTVWGACPDEVVLTHTQDDRSAVVSYGAGAGLQNVSIRNAAYVGILISGASADLSLAGVLVDGVTYAGIAAVEGASFSARNIVVRGTRAHALDGTGGLGIMVRDGGSGELVDSALLGNRLAGSVSSGPGSSLRASGTVIADTESQMSDGTAGLGLQSEDGATAVLVESVIEGNCFTGVAARTTGTAEIEGCVVRGQRSETATGTHGSGLWALSGGSLVARRTLIERNRSSGVFSDGAGSTVIVEDIVVRDTQPRERDHNTGTGLHAQRGGSATIRRALIVRNHSQGLVATSGSTLDAEDVIVRDTRESLGDGLYGRGVACAHSTCTLSRLLVERSADTGVSAIGEDTTLLGEDLEVRETGVASGPARGVNVQEGASAQLTRARIETSTEGGVVVLAARLTAVDLTVRNPAPTAVANTGRGLDVELGSVAEVRNLLVEDARQFGVLVLDAQLTLERVAVLGTREQTCTGEICELLAAGTAVASLRSASVVVEDFVVRGADLCGVHVAGGSSLDLRRGSVSGATIGACVQVDGYDISRLMQDVAYRDNDTNLDSTNLPVPEPIAPSGAEG